MSFPRPDKALFRIACCSLFYFITFCDKKLSLNGKVGFVSCSLEGVRLRLCSLLIVSEIMLETGVTLGSYGKNLGFHLGLQRGLVLYCFYFHTYYLKLTRNVAPSLRLGRVKSVGALNAWLIRLVSWISSLVGV